MIDRILAPLDGSVHSDAAISEMGVLLRRKDVEVVILRVVELPITMNRDLFARQLDERRREARMWVDDRVASLSRAGVNARAMTGEGHPTEVILEAARATGAGMLLIATHDGSGFDLWQPGSVTEKVVRASDVPVMTVRPRSGEVPPGGVVTERPLRKFLLAVDGSDPSVAAVRAAIELAVRCSSEIVLLHVREGAAGDGSAGEACVAAATKLVEGAGLRCAAHFRDGRAVKEILKGAEEAGADLIVMGSHGRTGLLRWALGSTAEKVVRTATVPVLVVRAAGAKSGPGASAEA